MHTKTLRILAIVLGALLLAYNASADEKQKEKPKQKPFVIYRIGLVPVEMVKGDDFAVMLTNDGSEEKPSPRFILANGKKRTLLSTKDFDAFKLALNAIPKGTEVHRYDSETVPRSWGLRPETFEKWGEAFAELGIKFAKDTRLTNYSGK